MKNLIKTIIITTSLCHMMNVHFAMEPAKRGKKHANENQFHELFTAILIDDADKVQLYINAGLDLDQLSTKSDDSPLIFAVHLNRPNIVKKLIAAGANINLKNPQTEQTALMAAAMYYLPEIIQILLDAGADPTITNKYGKTALDIASFPFYKYYPYIDDATAQKNRLKIIEILTEHTLKKKLV